MTASEANQRFSELLRRVQQGETFTITSRGRPVARVRPVGDRSEERARRVEGLLDYVQSLPASQAHGWRREDLYE